jgi:uncharacterized protein
MAPPPPAPGTPTARSASLAVLVAAVYTGGMGLIWLATGYHYDEPTRADEIGLSAGLLPLIGVVAMLGWRAGLWRPRPTPTPGSRAFALIGALGLLFPIPGFALALLRSVTPVDWTHLALTLVACLLVGVGEELAYRGVALNALLRSRTVPAAVAVSTVLFALLHTSNVVAGRDLESVLIQIGITTVLGSIFAWTYLFSGRNLALVMALHGGYDFGFGGAAATPYGENPLTFWTLGVLGVVAVTLAVAGVRWSHGNEAALRAQF